MMKNFPVVGFIGGLLVTIKTTFRKPVTAEYPVQEKRLPLADKYMGFPALTWDFEVDEPYCTGCMAVSYTHLTLPTNREV